MTEHQTFHLYGVGQGLEEREGRGGIPFKLFNCCQCSSLLLKILVKSLGSRQEEKIYLQDYASPVRLSLKFIWNLLWKFVLSIFLTGYVHAGITWLFTLDTFSAFFFLCKWKYCKISQSWRTWGNKFDLNSYTLARGRNTISKKTKIFIMEHR